MARKHLINNVDLQSITHQLKEVIAFFCYCIVSHIYRELNRRVDALSKEALFFPIGEVEFTKGTINESRQFL